MVNQILVKRLLGNLHAHVADLRECQSIPLTDYEVDVKTQRYVERTLHIALETVLDITHHIISDENFREPKSYADAFSVLAEHKVISSTLAEKCRKMAQFRNLLVHAYERIDPAQVYGIVQRSLDDLVSFASQIFAFVNQSQSLL